MKSKYQGVTFTRAPLRVSFAGGGTDLPQYYRKTGGLVVSTAIDLFVDVAVLENGANDVLAKHLIEKGWQRVDPKVNRILAHWQKFPPLSGYTVFSVSDVPHSSGLGSSSAFATALVTASLSLESAQASAPERAERAFSLEIDGAGAPIGKQDHYSASMGGFNAFRFHPDDRVETTPLSGDLANRILSHAMLFSTGIRRSAGPILREQVTNMSANMKAMERVTEAAEAMLRCLAQNSADIRSIGDLLDAGWQAKRCLAKRTSSPEIDARYDAAMHAGAVGGKICGAGGGGYLMLLVPHHARDAVRQAVMLPEQPVRSEPQGACVVSRPLFLRGPLSHL